MRSSSQGLTYKWCDALRKPHDNAGLTQIVPRLTYASRWEAGNLCTCRRMPPCRPGPDIPHSVAAVFGAPDPRLAASLMAVERAFAWYLEEAAVAKAPPVSGADARALREALAGRRPWQPEHFDRLVTFAQAMHRLAADGRQHPHLQPGRLPDRAEPRGHRPGEPSAGGSTRGVDPEVFAKLEFRETSLGIAKAQRENREGWWAHAQKNRAFIEQAAATLERADAGGGAGGRAAVRSAAGGAGPPVPAPGAGRHRRRGAGRRPPEAVRREVPRRERWRSGPWI